MAKTYFIWKNGHPNDWLQISGKEFYTLVNSKKGSNRYFVHLSGMSELTAEPDDIYMESTFEQYQKYLQEKNHSDYLNRFSQNIQHVSLDQAIIDSSNQEKLLHELISDGSEPVDKQVIENMLRENLQKALNHLSEDEFKLITALFVRDISQNQLAQELSITQQMVSKQKKKILKKLKLLVVKNEKSQQ